MSAKRFIAGAVCPSCGVMDTIRVFTHGGQERRECVECGYTDVKSFEHTLEGHIPKTRIIQEERIPDQTVELIRILDK